MAEKPVEEVVAPISQPQVRVEEPKDRIKPTLYDKLRVYLLEQLDIRLPERKKQASVIEKPKKPDINRKWFKKEKRKENQLFAELYSWYLNSPDYCTMTKKLTDAAFLRKPVDQISKSVAKALYGEISPNGATRLERFFCMCICTFSEIWT